LVLAVVPLFVSAVILSEASRNRTREAQSKDLRLQLKLPLWLSSPKGICFSPLPLLVLVVVCFVVSVVFGVILSAAKDPVPPAPPMLTTPSTHTLAARIRDKFRSKKRA
jgi:hypothetical protein